MKTINSFRQYLPALIFTLAVLACTIESGAQNHRKNDRENENYRKEYRDNEKREKGNREYTKNDYKSDRKELNKRHLRHRDVVVYTPHYSKKYGHSHRNYSVHPKYGRVYDRFDSKPYVFRHKHGDYYYFGNQFYNYRKGIGYYVVEPPRNIYFNDLPFRCERVYVNGHVYYRNGDLYFSYSPRGYVIAPAPIHINLSLRF
jgi:hypothetical protein